MSTKDDINQIYIDTSLLHEWFARLMRGEKQYYEPKIIAFLRKHSEINKFISIFTIAELVESLLFREKGIHDHMKKLETINSFVQVFVETTGIKIIEFEKKDVHRGIFISPNIVKYTAECGEVKDAIHVCIAEHEDLALVTHDDKFGRIKPLYEKIVTDKHLMKLFKE